MQIYKQYLNFVLNSQIFFPCIEYQAKIFGHFRIVNF